MSTYIEKFKNNLRDLSVNKDQEDLRIEWKYIGGDKNNKHILYYTLNTNQENKDKIDFPHHDDKCLCGHPIVEQCWIRNNISNNILVVGNCCVNKIGILTTTKCLRCYIPHKNRINMYCNKCTKIINKEKEIEKYINKIQYETLGFGKYNNMSNIYVFENDKDYCSYVMNQEMPGKYMRRFQKFIELKNTYDSFKQKQENQEQ